MKAQNLKITSKVSDCVLTNYQHTFIEGSEFDKISALFEKFSGLKEFHPTSSVTGAVLAQEVQKIVANHGRPIYGFLTYDAKNQKSVTCYPDFLTAES